jgi:hypothetical protein
MLKIKRYFQNSLIVAYLATIYFSGVPETNTLNFRMKQKAQDLSLAIGINPSWSMFAPNPIKFDTKSFVEITYEDGEVELHDVEINLDGLLATFRKARWMKYAQDNLRSPNQKGLLNPAIRHFVAKYGSVDRPIKEMVLKRKWWDVKPFYEGGIDPISNSRVPKENSEILLTQNFEN